MNIHFNFRFFTRCTFLGPLGNADKENIAGKITKMLVQFSTKDQEAVKVKVGLSTASGFRSTLRYYHALLMPNLVTDVHGSYSGWDHQLHKSTVGDMYSNFSLWDTYRALHPVYDRKPCHTGYCRCLSQGFQGI